MDRWTHIFFSFSNALTHVSQRRRHQEADFEVIDPTEGGFEGIQEEQVVASEEESADDGSSRVSFPQCVVTQEPGPHPRAPEVTAHGEPVSMSSNHSLSYIREGSFMDWLKSIFTLGDEEISEVNHTILYFRPLKKVHFILFSELWRGCVTIFTISKIRYWLFGVCYGYLYQVLC